VRGKGRRKRGEGKGRVRRKEGREGKRWEGREGTPRKNPGYGPDKCAFICSHNNNINNNTKEGRKS